jgi:hypothetical protein
MAYVSDSADEATKGSDPFRIKIKVLKKAICSLRSDIAALSDKNKVNLRVGKPLKVFLTEWGPNPVNRHDGSRTDESAINAGSRRWGASDSRDSATGEESETNRVLVFEEKWRQEVWDSWDAKLTSERSSTK